MPMSQASPVSLTVSGAESKPKVPGFSNLWFHPTDQHKAYVTAGTRVKGEALQNDRAESLGQEGWRAGL